MTTQKARKERENTEEVLRTHPGAAGSNATRAGQTPLQRDGRAGEKQAASGARSSLYAPEQRKLKGKWWEKSHSAISTQRKPKNTHRIIQILKPRVPGRRSVADDRRAHLPGRPENLNLHVTLLPQTQAAKTDKPLRKINLDKADRLIGK